MTPTEYIAALDALGWSVRHLARLLDCAESVARAGGTGRAAVPAPVATWLRGLVRYHAAHPAPQWRTRSAT